MRETLFLSLFIAFLALSHVCAESTVNGNVEVTTKYGKVKGYILDFPNGNGIHVFTGIPYAAPPVGPLRFKPPQKPAAWQGTLDATQYGTSCHSAGVNLFNSSEDCLFLNVHVPYKGANIGKAPFPVLFYVHGGGYLGGSGSINSGFFLAQKGVIVVTMNYRLQALGFLNTGDDVAPGNYGMLDQQAALEFVKENIGAFGGNPDEVTLYGQSAGATSVSLHLLAPKSIPMFKRAILGSGADQATWAMIEPKWKPSDYSRSLAEDLGCPTDNSTAMVECLRALPADQISEASTDVLADIKTGAIHIPWAPVVDGPDGFLPDTPENLRKSGAFAKVPLLAGITTNELGAMPIEEELSRAEFLETLRDMVELVGKNNTDQQHDALSFEYSYWPNIHNGTQNRKTFLDIPGDVLFNGPVDTAVKWHANVTENTYSYVFGYQSPNSPEPAYTAVSHSGEIPFTFGYPFYDKTTLELADKELSYNYTDQDRAFSDTVMTMLTNFIKSGNPTPVAVDGVTWNSFKNSDMQVLYMGMDWGHLKNYRQHKYAFWNDYAPKVISYHICPPPEKKGIKYVKDLLLKGSGKRNLPVSKLRAEVERYARSRKIKHFIDILSEQTH